MRVPSKIVSAFARLGVGSAFVKINHEDLGQPDENLVEPVFLLAAGPELTLFHVYLRLRGTATLLPSDSFVGYGAELGAVF